MPETQAFLVLEAGWLCQEVPALLRILHPGCSEETWDMQVHPSQPQTPRRPESVSPHTMLGSEGSPGPPHGDTEIQVTPAGLWGWRDKEGDVASRVSGLHLLNSAAAPRAPLRSREAEVLREMMRPFPFPSAYITDPTCRAPGA